MSENGTHPHKPKTEWCRRAALMKWKGWSEETIDTLVRLKMLLTKRFPPARHKPKAKRKHKLGRKYYHVSSAEKL